MNPSTSDQESTPEVLMWAEYPGGSFQAGLQSDGKSVYFVIQSDNPQHGQPRWTWVRNLAEAPLNFSKREEDAFRPALLPSSYCAHPSGAEKLDLENCKIVWMEQGGGAALVENDEILALIPPLLHQNLPGYAKDCVHQSQIALPLENDDLYQQEIPQCQQYWDQWSNPSLVEEFYNRLTSCYVESFGPLKAQFGGQDPDRWPQMGILKFETSDLTILTSVGVSIRKQPEVESKVQNFEDHQRIELAMALPKDPGEKLLQLSLSRLMTIARYPWFIFTHFLPMQTFQWQSPLDEGSKAAVFWPDAMVRKQLDTPEVNLPAYFGLKPNLLWVCPHESEQNPDPKDFQAAWSDS